MHCQFWAMAQFRPHIHRDSWENVVESNVTWAEGGSWNLASNLEGDIWGWEGFQPSGEGTWARWDGAAVVEDGTLKMQLALILNARRVFPLPSEQLRPVGEW